MGEVLRVQVRPVLVEVHRPVQENFLHLQKRLTSYKPVHIS